MSLGLPNQGAVERVDCGVELSRAAERSLVGIYFLLHKISPSFMLVHERSSKAWVSCGLVEPKVTVGFRRKSLWNGASWSPRFLSFRLCLI
jgi:hypothetical protein